MKDESSTKVKKLPKRGELPSRYKWRLEDIYPDNEAWEKDFQELKALFPEISGYRGRLGESAHTLLSVLNMSVECSKTISKLYCFSRMRRDEDNSENQYQAMTDRVQALAASIGAAKAFMIPEILGLGEEKVASFMQELPDLELYRHYFDKIFRQKDHVLFPEEEEILAQAYEIAETAATVFTMFNNADLKFPVIKGEDGEDIELTKGRYIQFLESRDRRVRHDAFKALYSTYGKYLNTISSTLSGAMKSDIFFSRTRRYGSALEASLDNDNITTEVYSNLISTVKGRLSDLHHYIALRRRILGIDELHMYDLYVPMIKDFDIKKSYDEAVEIVIEGLSPLGSEYLAVLSEGFRDGWVDVFENEGKTSGAYSWGTYESHPYILLNYRETLDNIFTIAHEMGHALHTYYSNKNQPYIYAGYSIFVAEVASTLNEALLMKHMLDKAESRIERMYLTNQFLEQFRGTLFRQTMFAEFEMIIHELVENGGALTAETLNSIYYKLNLEYFGSGVVIDKEIEMEWCRIPHFYSSFYVYKYATGFSAAIALSRAILSEGEAAVERYLEFLKGGSSDYPLNLLKRAGVDLTTPKPVEDALDLFGELVTDMERMALS